MKQWGYFFIIAVSVLNISLNTWALKAAKQGENDFSRSLCTPQFKLAFFFGLCSLFCLLAVYVSNINNLSRGLLLMGATSIVGGTIFGMVVRGDKLTSLEWLLFLVITILFSYRIVRGFTT